MEWRKANSNGRIPYKEFFFVGVTTLAAALPITCLFPFMYFMVRDFHIAKIEEDIGFYAGFLGDHIGRKPVIVFSILSVVILNTLFGLSVTYHMAIATRFILGALNGLLDPIKAYCCEVCQNQHQALGLSVVNTAWGFGLIVGPALGGYLAQPAAKYPHIFSSGSIFGRFPYLLPCLSVSTFSAIVLISCTWLPFGDIKKSLLQNKLWMSTVLPCCVFGLHDTAYSEILSLWALSDRKYGGLSFSTEDIGEVLSVAGAGLLVYQLFIYHWVHKILGTINSSRTASAISIVVLATYPFMTYLSRIKLSLIPSSAAMVKSALAITVSAGINLLQNNAVCQEQRGTANGILTTAIAFFKALAPIGAGAIFSWTQKRQDAAFLPGDQLVFVMLNLMELVGLLSTFEPFLVLPA